MKKFFLMLLALASIPALAINPDIATGSYRYEEDGFYASRYDRMPDIDESCEKFNGQILRGGQPDTRDSVWIETLRANKVSLVIDLRAEGDRRDERKAALEAGMEYVNLPLRAIGPNQDRYLEVEVATPCFESNCEPQIETKSYYRVDATVLVLKKIRQALKDGKNVFYHCKHGQDRTGMLTAFLRHCSNWKHEFDNYEGTLYSAIKAHMREVQSSSAYRDLF